MSKVFSTLSSILLFSCLASAAVAPSFRAPLMQGGMTTLESRLQPGRTLLVCFWATWCAPCIQELRAISDKMKADGKAPIDLLTVNVDTQESATDVKPTYENLGFAFPVVLDPKQEIFSKYRPDKLLPFSVAVNEKGQILESFVGYQEKMFETVRTLALQAEKKG